MNAHTPAHPADRLGRFLIAAGAAAQLAGAEILKARNEHLDRELAGAREPADEHQDDDASPRDHPRDTSTAAEHDTSPDVARDASAADDSGDASPSSFGDALQPGFIRANAEEAGLVPRRRRPGKFWGTPGVDLVDEP